ncbi:hypothetical protein RHMOL_Rhmol07G0224300 [Rhododendron molle]|uniref:Uncharacterized protein n=1 Tax=Rhododendron molle TaxID=49168 RepID=A0ACC0N4K6_RHOML|nr:hypothetical protein RHMOL_Rhmol07G0224300 [Rhododendron molle]
MLGEVICCYSESKLRGRWCLCCNEALLDSNPLIKKVHRLLPPSGSSNDFQIQFESTFDYKEKKNIDDDLVTSYGPFNPEEFEEETILTPDVFEETYEFGYFKDFPIFDEYPNEELAGVLGDDCAFEIEDEFEDLPILISLQKKTFEVTLKTFLSMKSIQMRIVTVTTKEKDLRTLMVQDTPLEVALASSLVLASKPVMPKEDKGFLGQLEDPLGMLFTRVSLGYE